MNQVRGRMAIALIGLAIIAAQATNAKGAIISITSNAIGGTSTGVPAIASFTNDDISNRYLVGGAVKIEAADVAVFKVAIADRGISVIRAADAKIAIEIVSTHNRIGSKIQANISDRINAVGGIVAITKPSSSIRPMSESR